MKHAQVLFHGYSDSYKCPNSPWSIELFTALPGCCLLGRTPFSNVVRMRTRSLVPKPRTTVIDLGARQVDT